MMIRQCINLSTASTLLTAYKLILVDCAGYDGKKEIPNCECLIRAGNGSELLMSKQRFKVEHTARLMKNF